MFVLRVCLVAALGGLLFGYDTAVISGAIGFLQEHFKLNAAMKGWAASSALLGCVIGVSVAGLASDFAGRKKTLVLSGILFLALRRGHGDRRIRSAFSSCSASSAASESESRRWPRRCTSPKSRRHGFADEWSRSTSSRLSPACW